MALVIFQCQVIEMIVRRACTETASSCVQTDCSTAPNAVVDGLLPHTIDRWTIHREGCRERERDTHTYARATNPWIIVQALFTHHARVQQSQRTDPSGDFWWVGTSKHRQTS